MKKNKIIAKQTVIPGGEVVFYKAPDGSSALEVRLEKDSVWLDARQMARVFGRDRTVIVKHIQNVYKTGELESNSTCAKIAQVASLFNSPSL